MQDSKPHVNILIATPGRNMEVEYVKSLIQTINFLDQIGLTYLFLSEYSSMVTSAREATIMGSKNLNIYCKEPLNNHVTYDKIIWIDSDISWTIEDFMKLYNAEEDIVSGLYFDQHMTPMCSKNGKDLLNLTECIKNKEKVEIDAAGFGFIAMKSGVFENIKRPWFETQFINIDEEDPSIIVPLGEDYSWCHKASDNGYKIWLDPTILLMHHKKVAVGMRKEEEDAEATL